MPFSLRQPTLQQRSSALRLASRSWSARRAQQSRSGSVLPQPRLQPVLAPAAAHLRRQARCLSLSASASSQQYAPLGEPHTLRVKKNYVSQVEGLFKTETGTSGLGRMVVDLIIDDPYLATVSFKFPGEAEGEPRRVADMGLVEFMGMFNYTDVKKLFRCQFGIKLEAKGGKGLTSLVGKQERNALVEYLTCNPGRKSFALEVLVGMPTTFVCMQRLHDCSTIEDLPPLPHDASTLVKATMACKQPEQKHAQVVHNKVQEECASVWQAVPPTITAVRDALGPDACTIFPYLPKDNLDALAYLAYQTAIKLNASLDTKLRSRDTISLADAKQQACLYTIYFENAATGQWCIKVGYTKLTPAMRKTSADTQAGVQRAADTYLKKRGIKSAGTITPMVFTFVPWAEARKTKDLVKGFLRAVIHGPYAAAARDTASTQDIIRGVPAAVVEGGRWRFVDHVMQHMVMIRSRVFGRAVTTLDPSKFVQVLEQPVEKMRKVYDAEAVARVRLFHLEASLTV